jgi:hypothetical protein
MTLADFLTRLKTNPKAVTFPETIAIIEEHYGFTPTAFQNGNQYNGVGENSGSCKIFAFADLQNLSKDETLACFGAYYFEEVLNYPEETSHQNIRNFMKTGWDGIRFEGEALIMK